jgi:hypothetical protein
MISKDDIRREQPTWLLLEPEPVLAFLHLPPAMVAARGTAVLMCPPFGWSDMVSYRTRRGWAAILAQAGTPTARITFPSMGDSGGLPTDPGRLDAWTESVAAAAAWLREATGCTRIAALGIELGGIVACRALAQGAPIDDLALWAVPNSGRRLIRTMQLHMGVVAEQERKRPAPKAAPDGSLELLGFLITGETRRELERLKLNELVLPDLAGRRVLLLEEGGVGVDDALRQHLAQAGAEISVANAGDLGVVMTAPDVSALPEDAVRATTLWLAGAETRWPASAPGRVSSPAHALSADLRVGEQRIRETPIFFDLADRPGFGILTEPIDCHPGPVTAVLLNTGATPHIGPNRQWVESARRWAACGIPSIRMDLAGIGDADGDSPYDDGVVAMYTQVLTRQVLALIDQLEDRGLPPRFVVAGACAGAFWGLNAALANPQIVSVMLLDLATFDAESVRLHEATRLRRAMLERLRNRNFGVAQLRTAMRALTAGTLLRVGVEKSLVQQSLSTTGILDRLRDQGTQTLIALTGRSPLRDRFEQDPQLTDLLRWPNLRLELLDSDDHMFRSFEDQRTVNRLIDDALDRAAQLMSQS